jgi:hypothetical protein
MKAFRSALSVKLLVLIALTVIRSAGAVVCVGPLQDDQCEATGCTVIIGDYSITNVRRVQCCDVAGLVR